jgi:methionine--tRNA ligase beta chain
MDVSALLDRWMTDICAGRNVRRADFVPLCCCNSTGVPSFLSGKARLEKTPDVRSKSIPSKIVTSMEELLELQKAEASSNSSSSSTPKEAKPEKKKKQPTAPSADIDISKLDIRVGVITKAWLHEEADKLFCEEIDVGEDEPRQIASGLRAHYNLEDLEGQRVLVLANLKARKLVGFASHGMVMCAADGEGNVKFVEPPTDAAIGERIFVEGFEGGEPATGNQLDKKKMLEKIFPDLKTNASGVACYHGKPLSTSAGPCLPTLPNAEVA